MEIPQVVEIIKKCGLSIKMGIKNMLKMAQRNDISGDVVNNIPIREGGIKKRDQTSKYTILNNGSYYVRHYWYKNQKVREILTVPCHWYFYNRYGLKLFIQTFIYNIIPKKRSGVEVNFDVIWSTIQMGK